MPSSILKNTIVINTPHRIHHMLHASRKERHDYYITVCRHAQTSLRRAQADTTDTLRAQNTTGVMPSYHHTLPRQYHHHHLPSRIYLYKHAIIEYQTHCLPRRWSSISRTSSRAHISSRVVVAHVITPSVISRCLPLPITHFTPRQINMAPRNIIVAECSIIIDTRHFNIIIIITINTPASRQNHYHSSSFIISLSLSSCHCHHHASLNNFRHDAPPFFINTLTSSSMPFPCSYHAFNVMRAGYVITRRHLPFISPSLPSISSSLTRAVIISTSLHAARRRSAMLSLLSGKTRSSLHVPRRACCGERTSSSSSIYAHHRRHRHRIRRSALREKQHITRVNERQHAFILFNIMRASESARALLRARSAPMLKASPHRARSAETFRT